MFLSRFGPPRCPCWLLAALALLLSGVGARTPPAARAQLPGGAIVDSLIQAPSLPPERVEVAMIFLAFDGSIRSKDIGRTRDQADSLARHLLIRARSGADFDSLKLAACDQPREKPVILVNKGVRPGPGERTRRMVEPAVGDLAFGMSIGNIGMVVPNNTTCRYGYYIVQRRR
ncbi:MAG: hypothetical protein SGI90_03435 [Candidatus Eisenbacteria bacterium]|nr:hypothetical protein [Candidatus Eisenbacteria bacterium]